MNNDIALDNKHIKDIVHAVKNGNVDELDCLLNDNPIDLKRPIDSIELKNGPGWTALHFAVKYKQIHVVQFLLDQGASIMVQDKLGNTPVHVAFHIHEYRMLDLLLSFHTNFNLNPANNAGISHFHIACTRNNQSIVKNFIQHTNYLETIAENEPTPLHLAVSHNKIRIVQLLLAKNGCVRVKDAQGCTPLNLACQNAYVKFREFIFENNTKKIIDWSSNRREHLQIIKLLLKYKSDVNCLDNLGNGPLSYACDYFPQITRFEIREEIKDTLNEVIRSSLSAELNDRHKIIFDILLKSGVDANKCYKNGSILHFLCSTSLPHAGTQKKVKFFLKSGSDVNVKNTAMLTPLHLAVTKKINKDLVKLLLNNNADINCLGGSKLETPLHCALKDIRCNKKSMKIIDLLLQQNPDIYIQDEDGNTALHSLVSQIEHVFFPQVTPFLKPNNDEINLKNKYGNTALFSACAHGNFVSAAELLGMGADINVENDKEQTIFCYIYDRFFEYDQQWRTNLDLMQVIHVLNCYVNKMIIIGNYISEKVIISKAKLKDHAKELLDTHFKNDEQKLTKDYKKEVNVLKSIKVDNMNSLYDILFKDENSMAKHVQNSSFQQIMSTIDQYLYSDVLKLKFHLGTVRSGLLMPAKFLINHFTKVELPDCCSEHIFKFMTNTQLKNFVEMLPILIVNEKEDASPIVPLQVRKKTKNG